MESFLLPGFRLLAIGLFLALSKHSRRSAHFQHYLAIKTNLNFHNRRDCLLATTAQNGLTSPDPLIILMSAVADGKPLSWAARQANQKGPIPTRPHSRPPSVPLDAISMETLDAVAKSCPPSAAKITLEKGLPTKNHFSFLFLSCPGSFPLSCTRLTRIKPVSIWKLRAFFRA